jgi:hypothetical protein
LKYAKRCLGEEKHYKEILTMEQAYSQLKFIIRNTQEEEEQDQDENLESHQLIDQ